MNGLNQLVLVVAVVAVGCEAGMFGAGNVMARRYPNGPTEFHGMKVPIYGPTTTQSNDRPIVSPAVNSAVSPAVSPASSSVVGVRTADVPEVKVDTDRWWDFKTEKPRVNFRKHNYGNYC